MSNNIQESINRAIQTMIDYNINTLSLDKTIIGVIDSVVNSTQGIYKIKYNGGYFNAKAQQENAIFPAGMAVYVQVPQNDFNKEKFIIGRASSTTTNTRTDVTVSAIHNYSIVGMNLLSADKEKEDINVSGIALRSYHDPREEDVDDEEAAKAAYSHRYRELYNYNEKENIYNWNSDDFELAKKETTALMIEADFRTNLSAEQQYQSSGNYGLGLNLVFKNTDFKYGDTQGERLEYFAPNIVNETTIIVDGSYETVDRTLSFYQGQIETEIEKVNTIDEMQTLQGEDKFLDLYAAYIESLFNAYKEANAEQVVEEEEQIVQSYILRLRELSTIAYDSPQAFKDDYYTWFDEPIGTPRYKTVTYHLDCGDMIGNPYNYKSWSTQYALFDIDIENFERIENIVFYKDGFKIDSGKEKDDIFIRNVKIYALKPITSTNGDYRLEIQYKNGMSFSDFNDEELNIQAKVTKQYYEDLSRNATFYWFKKDPSITTVGNDKYHQMGGIGWRYLDKGNTNYFSSLGSENTAYENIYKVTCLIDETIILSEQFYLYNNKAKSKISLSSDLGTSFAFDAGTPIITCLIDTETENTVEEEHEYKYYWSININGQKTYLRPEDVKQEFSYDIESIQSNLILANVLKNVQFYIDDTLIDDEDLKDNYWKANRIKYPVINNSSEKAVTFECTVQEKKTINGKLDWYDIGSGTLTISNQNNVTIGDCYIVIENGEQVFQYDTYGNAPNSKKLKSPQEIKPLICHVFKPNGIEISNNNYSLKWKLPVVNSMISSKADLKQDPSTLLFNIDESTQCKFEIAEQYNPEYTNNQIQCQVILNGTTYTQETKFVFKKIGENGTNGTDVVVNISPVVDNQILNEQPLTLYRSSFVDGKATKLELNDGWKSDTQIIQLTNTHGLKAQLFQKNEEIVEGVSFRWNVAGSTQIAANNKGRFLELQDNGAGIVWNENYNPDKLNNLIVRVTATYNDKEYYAFYPLCVIDYAGTLPGQSRVTIDKNFLLKEIIYNADGRNPIYNHNQGIKINNLKNGDFVIWEVENNGHSSNIKILLNQEDKDGVVKTPGIKQTIDDDGQIVQVPHVIKLIKTNKTITDDYLDSHPELVENQDYVIDNTIQQIYILPSDEYLGNYVDNNIIGTVYNSQFKVKAKVTVPILMTLNTFGLASLNGWDGISVNINEDEGSIMAPQIGAGVKDDNNRFTGVLMGSNQDGDKGLFGYSHGAQSIFLDASTGEATFGLPDGVVLLPDEKGTLAPAKGYEYTEGRIELRPGDVSKIGGWRLGRKSLYYIKDENNQVVDISDKYKDADAVDHEKDIGHEHKGILLNAADSPYISIKGRPLTVGQGSHYDIDNTSGNAAVDDGDSLELNLDPNHLSFFTIYRHYKQNDEWDREPLVGIDAMGRFYTNALRDKETSLNMNYVPGFGKKVTDKKYLGLNIGYGKDTLFKAFVQTNATNSDTVYISGGTLNNEYNRPLSLHGKSISLYAASSSTDTTSNSYIQINTGSAYIGTSNYSRLDLQNGTTSTSSLYAYNTLNINAQTLNLYSRNKVMTLSALTIGGSNSTYIQLTPSGSLSGVAASGLNLTGKNGNINLTRQSTSGSTSTTLSQLNLTNTDITLALATSGNTSVNRGRLYLINTSNSTSYLDSIPNLQIRSNNNVTIKSYGSRTTLSTGGSQEGHLYVDSGSNWSGGYTTTMTGLSFNQTSIGGFSFQSNAKPGRSGSYNTNQAAASTYGGATSALVGHYTGTLGATWGNTQNGLYFNWGLFPGRMFSAAADTTTEDYLNTSIYARYRIVSNSEIKAHGNVVTLGKFQGNGSEITNTGSGDTVNENNITIGGYSGSGSFKVPNITWTNGRPVVGTKTVTINMPAAQDLGAYATMSWVTGQGYATTSWVSDNYQSKDGNVFAKLCDSISSTDVSTEGLMKAAIVTLINRVNSIAGATVYKRA